MGDLVKNNKFDAIVIGSGMTGGWAAKELTEKGLKTLVLERGRNVIHLKDYPTTNKYPWEFEHRGKLPLKIRKVNPIITQCYVYQEDSMHFFTKDTEHPYIQERPFSWIRAYQVGGRSLVWSRMTQRWSNFDFEGPARDGFAVDWPIRYEDLAPWYSHVERFIGISGSNDGLSNLPDGELLPPFELTCVEEYFKKVLSENYTDRHVTPGRCAHLTEPQPIHIQQGRGKCQNRDLCRRGCPFGGYFSSNSSTLPWAARTGNLTLRPFSVVHSIIYDTKKNKATGIRVKDAISKQSQEYFAPLIFVNAGTLNTNIILLNSKSSRFPNGLGNDNGLLGKFIAFHNNRGHVASLYNGLSDKTTDGRNPTPAYIPRFRNLRKQETDFLRGYATALFAYREEHYGTTGKVGSKLKDALSYSKLGPWEINTHMIGETIPKESNSVSLDESQEDEWGIPLIRINVGYDENDEKMVKDFQNELSEMHTKAGFTHIKASDSHQPPGLDTHEMGGVRMGKDPKTSLLNKWNQLHNCPNVFVTDGACMTSTSTQNPSLTFMALTARAIDYAIQHFK